MTQKKKKKKKERKKERKCMDTKGEGGEWDELGG